MDFLNLVAQAIQKGGWIGYVVLAFAFVGALLTGTIQSKREVTTRNADHDKAIAALLERLGEMRVDRDYWKTTAQSLTKTLEQLTDVMESAQGRGGKR